MLSTLLLLSILGSPSFEGGVRLSSGVVDESLVVTPLPWIALKTDSIDSTLALPLQVDIGAGELRSEDWNEPGDFGRLVHRFEFREWLRAGAISALSLSNSTIIRGYNNGVLADHGRLGLIVSHGPSSDEALGPSESAATIFCDQVLGTPVFGGDFRYRVGPLNTSVTLAMDPVAPDSESTGLTRSGLPHGPTSPRWAGGFGIRGRVLKPTNRTQIYAHADGNTIDGTGFGLHSGLALDVDFGEAWRWVTAVEGLLLGPGYTWSLFDTGYLIDRYRNIPQQLRRARLTYGARFTNRLVFSDIAILGAHFAQVDQSGRADLDVFGAVVLGRVNMSGTWRVRSPKRLLGLFSHRHGLAAFNAQLELAGPLSAGLLLARDWRVQRDSLQLRPTTTLLMSIEGAWSSR